VDETAWQINGVGEWYAMYFDKATTEHVSGTFRGKYASQNWATDKVYESADVGAATRSLTVRARLDEKNVGFDKEISIYKKAKTGQQTLLKQLVADEVSHIAELTEMMAK
jgi:hypothetical protein